MPGQQLGQRHLLYRCRFFDHSWGLGVAIEDQVDPGTALQTHKQSDELPWVLMHQLLERRQQHRLVESAGTAMLTIRHQVSSTARRAVVPSSGPWDQSERWGISRR